MTRRDAFRGLALSALVMLVLGPASASAQPSRIYWSFVGDTDAASTVSRASIDGADVQGLLSGVFASGIAINPLAGTMYIADASAGSIRVCTTDGVSCSTVVAAAGFTGDIDIDIAGGHIYWTRFDDGTIRRANLDGTNVVTVLDSLGFPFGLSLDLIHRRIYWADPALNRMVYRARLDGTGPRENLLVPETAGRPRGVAYDPNDDVVYYSDENNDTIVRIDLSMPQGAGLGYASADWIVGGSGAPPPLDAMAEPWDIELDGAGFLYWVARTGVWRAEVDGTGAVELIPGPFVDDEWHAAIALELPISPNGAACSNPGSCASRRCVDGVCCATDCDEYCHSCRGADTGMADGECHPATAAPGMEPSCNDHLQCTDDYCLPDGGCMIVPQERACDDGDPCTVGDQCVGSACVPGAYECDAGLPDAGAIVDGGGDAATDAGSVEDAGRDAALADATVGLDAGIARDAGLSRDASLADATVGFDAGTTSGDTDGCGCRAAGSGRGGIPWIVLVLGLFAFPRSRRYA